MNGAIFSKKKIIYYDVMLFEEDVMDYSDKLRIIENIVKAPLFSVVGFTMNKIIYVTTLEGVRSLWLMDISNKEKIKLAEDVSSVSNVVQGSPYLLYTRDVAKGKELHKAFIVNIESLEQYEVSSLAPRRITNGCFDGEKFAISSSTESILDLWIIKPDASAEKVYEANKLFFAVDLEGDKIVGEGLLRGDPRSQELFIFNINTGEFQVFTPKEGSTNRNPKIHDDSILFATTAFGKEKLVVMNLGNGELIEPEMSFDEYRKYEFNEYVDFDWDSNGKIWFIAVRNGRTKVFYDGKLIKLPEGFTHYFVPAGDKYYATWSSLTSPHKILEIDSKSGEVETLLGEELPNELRNLLGRSRFFTYKSFDGLEIPAFVIENGSIGKPGPTIIYVHGGPWYSVNDSWNRMIASLVASGYHLVAPNFRGSTGYGDEFRKLDIGDPGGGDLMDVVYAARWAKENNLASKIAIMGYSYGGYMTFLATVKEPDMWDAGVAGAGITDWEELYELSDALFKQFINTLFTGKRELLAERSAKSYVENLKAPLCIIHSQNDSRTPLKPVLKYVSRLLDLGKKFELHVIPDMGHVIVRVEDAVKILFPGIIFLDRELKK